MNKLLQKIFLPFLFFASATLCFSQEKPPLVAKDLEKNTYYFEIVDNKLVGDGAKFLTDEIKQSQYVLLGEYHGSLRISEFTKAVIPVFHEAGCRTFGLEIGPVSAEILSELSKDSNQTISSLRTFNSNYYVASKSRKFTPISMVMIFYFSFV
jgi:hypothetical protein